MPWAEAEAAGSFIGQKLVLNEFVATLSFTEQRAAFAPFSQAIITFALCGFANFSSIAILLGGLGSVAPNRREDIARFGLRALLAATLANLMSAAPRRVLSQPMTAILKPIDFAAVEAPVRFTEDLREIGFAVLRGAPLDDHAITRIYDAWLAFFQSPEKMAFRYDRNGRTAFSTAGGGA